MFENVENQNKQLQLKVVIVLSLHGNDMHGNTKLHKNNTREPP